MATRVDREGWEARLRALGLKGKLPGALTQGIVDAAKKPLGSRYMLADGEVPGLALQVNETGAASYVLQYRTLAGDPRRFGLGSARDVTLAQARTAAEKIRVGLREGRDPIDERNAARIEAERAKSNTLRAYLEQVYGPKALAHKKDGGAPKARKPGQDPKPSGTWARILSAWEPLLTVELTQLSRDMIEKVLADRKAKTNADDSPRLTLATLRRDWAALRALLADAVDRGHLAAVPMAKRPLPIRAGHDGEKEEGKRIRWLGQHDDKEEERFQKALDAFESDEPAGGDFLRCVAGLARASGMRRGDIVHLTEKMIDLREGRIALPGKVTKNGKPRIVYLNPPAVAALKLWKVRGKAGELFPGNPENWEDRITQREWPRLCEQAELEDFRFHDLRHDFAVRMLKSGATLAQVRDALGHASITQTEKYAHVVPSDVRRAVMGMA